MFRTAVRAFIPVLLLASAVSAEIVDPVFVRGNKNADGGFDHLAAFESASDMVKYQNQFWTQAMANPNYDKSAFFDGTNYYWVDSTSSPFYLHNYGPDLYSLMNDSGADTQTFNSHRFDGSWFADSEGAIYNVFRNADAEDYAPWANTIRQYASIVDVLANQGTTYSCPAYSLHDSFLSLNGKFYRIDTDVSDVTGITEYDSFADLLTGNWSAKQDGGFGSSHDLFMIVPRAALGLTGSPSPVPEIDPAGMGSILALLGGSLDLLERRRKRAGRTHTNAIPMNLLRRLATSTLIALAVAILGSTNARAVTIDMVTVGNQGNVGRTHNYGSFGGSLTFGAVNHSYQIGKLEVTISQYTAFLNAVAATDTHSLYNAGMASDGNISGIRQNGSSGNYTYSAIGSPDRPITYVSWFDAARFANWMHNGQGSGGTETGAYTLAGATSGDAVARNPGATFYIPTEDEWFKAAYYSPLLNSGAGGYYAYATQSNDAPGNQIIAGALNQANHAPGGVYSVTQSSSYSSSQDYLTDVGAFTGSPSFYGTFDQSGNVTEWNDLTGSAGAARGLRGGDWNDSGSPFGVSFTSRGPVDPAVEFNDVGFRLASPVPEIDPAGFGSVLALVAGALGLLERRRKRA